MMKLVAVLSVAIAIVAVQGLSEDVEAQIAPIRKECIKKSGVAEDVVKKMIGGDVPDEPKVKAFTLCFLKEIGFIGEDGSIKKDFIKLAIEEEYGADVATKITTNCGDKTGTTPLDTAFLLSKCFAENAPKDE